MPTALDPHASALWVHDLKNHLAEQGAMLAALDPRAADLPARIDALRRHGERLQRRLVEFLTLYRLDVEQPIAHATDASPARLLRAIAAHATAPRADLRLRVDAAAAPPAWVLDDQLVGLALEAALDNALRYARSEVVLGAAADGDWLVLWVEDDGPGPDGADATTPVGGPQAGPFTGPLTGPFNSHATGLGTALCRRVAARHASTVGVGSVSLRPRADGPGARFEMRLPA